MEPVFMILGQSSATAAAMAIDQKVPVQKVDYVKLRERLLADKQILEWTGAVRAQVSPAKLTGIVVDDAAAEKTGDWVASSAIACRIGDGYIHDGNAQKGEMSATFAPDVPKAGEYEVLLVFTTNPNRASNVPVAITTTSHVKKLAVVNERSGSGLAALGRFRLNAGKSITVKVSNDRTDGFVVVDGLQLVPIK
jgi:hypothetical protein